MTASRPRFPENDIVFSVKNPHRPGALAAVLSAISKAGGTVGDIKTNFVGKDFSFREITISTFDADHINAIKLAIESSTDCEVTEVKDLVFDRHRNGKIHCGRRHNLERLEDLRYIYTPGVARVCRAIQNDPSLARDFTAINQTVGIFTNGTRVLGLGDIGPVAGMPVMEGKAVIYDQFVGLSAVPILVDTKNPDEFINIVEKIAPTFGGIHLEDIRTPDCFYIENELIRRLNRPVMHDDQHGTATVLLAAVFSALRQTGRLHDSSLRFAQVGLGAAGFGIAKLLIDYGFSVIGVDPNPQSQDRLTMYGGSIASLADAMEASDVVIATTGVVGLINKDMIRPGQIILALSNPVPEIFPEEALAAGAAFASDGRSVNNALAFPGLFKAALQVGALNITSPMKIAAAHAISALADKDELVPSPFHPHVHERVVEAVVEAWMKEQEIEVAR